jgi:hypothetical protein
MPARITSTAQSLLWRDRESRESAAAVARTCAGYPDADEIADAIWLPTPI